MMKKYRSFVREQKAVRTLYLILLIVVSLAFLLFLLSKLLGERQNKIDLSFYLTMIAFLLLAALGIGVLVYLNRRIRKFKRLCADEAFPVVLLAENGLLQEIPLSKKQTVLIAFQFRTADDALKFLKKRRMAQQKVTAPIPGDAQIAFRRSKAPVTVYSRPPANVPAKDKLLPPFYSPAAPDDVSLFKHKTIVLQAEIAAAFLPAGEPPDRNGNRFVVEQDGQEQAKPQATELTK